MKPDSKPKAGWKAQAITRFSDLARELPVPERLILLVLFLGGGVVCIYAKQVDSPDSLVAICVFLVIVGMTVFGSVVANRMEVMPNVLNLLPLVGGDDLVGRMSDIPIPILPEERHQSEKRCCHRKPLIAPAFIRPVMPSWRSCAWGSMYDACKHGVGFHSKRLYQPGQLLFVALPEMGFRVGLAVAHDPTHNERKNRYGGRLREPPSRQ